MSWVSRLPLPLLLFARSHGGRNRALSALAVLALVTSVAMATGLEMSSRSVEGELEETADELAGSAELAVTAGAAGVPETLLGVVATTPGVRVAAPLLEVSFRIDGGPLDGRVLRVLGVDVLADPAVRTYRHVSDRVEATQPLRMLSDVHSAIVPEALAHELGLADGDTLPVRRGGETTELAVRGRLAPGGLADAFGGRIAVMDVYALQVLLDREGWLDRIDVVLEPDAERSQVLSALRERLEGRASVRDAAGRDEWVRATLITVRLVVSAMVLVAILVAALLAYGAMSLFVERRLAELSLLRTVGLEDRRLRRLLYVDALLLAVLGTAGGLGAGIVLSRSFVAVLSRITELLEDVQIAGLEPALSTLAVACVVGLGVTALGIVPPALRVTRRAPLDGLLSARGVSPDGSSPRRIGGLLGALGLLWLAALLAPVGLPALPRLGLVFGVGLVWIAVAARGPIPRAVAALRPLLERALPGIGRLAGASLVTRPGRAGVHLSAIAGVLAGITATGVLSQSLASTLDYWMAAQYPGGVFVTAGSTFSLRPERPIEPEVVETIRSSPGVRAVFDHWTTEILYEDEEVLLAAGDMEVMARYGRLPAIDEDPRELAWAVAEGAIAVSDGFAHRFGVEKGDVVVLATPKGRRRFPVAGVIRDYAGPSGSLNLDLRVFDRLWQRPGSRDLVLWTQRPVEPVLAGIERRVGESQDLLFVHGDALTRYASRLLSRFTRILDVVALLTAVLGGLAVLNLLLGAVGERKRELALLRSAGATRGQVSALILVDGLLAGVLGGAAGVALGLACAWPLVARVIPEALGWRLDFDVAPVELLVLVGGVALASLLAGLYPAWLARGVAPREVLAPE